MCRVATDCKAISTPTTIGIGYEFANLLLITLPEEARSAKVVSTEGETFIVAKVIIMLLINKVGESICDL